MKQRLIIDKNSPLNIEKLDNGDVSVSFIQPLNKGDIVLCQTPKSRIVCIYNGVVENQVHYLASYNLTANVFNISDWLRFEYIKRIATDKERAKLFQALDKNGFTWNPQTLELTETKDKTTIPDAIGIYQLMESGNENSSLHAGDGLFIGSEYDKALLCVINDGTYAVFKNSDSLFEKVKCRIVPCMYKDLKCGDTAFRGGIYSDNYKIAYYVKILAEGYVYLHKGTAIQSYDENYHWYKIVPV